jgi:hypothetical protein
MFSLRLAHLNIFAALLCSGLLLAGCAASDNDKTLSERLQLTTRVTEPKDWVVQSRPGDPDYIPVGVTPPQRPSAALDPAGLASATAETEAARDNAAATAKRPAPPPRIASQADALAEQKRRLAASGLLGAARLPSESNLRNEANRSREFARRPLPPTPKTVPKEQPTSWPVPEGRRRPNTLCPEGTTAEECQKPKS